MRRLLQWALGKPVDQNSWFLIVEIFWASIFASANTFNSAYAIRLGASNVQVSLLTAIPALVAVLITLPSGRFLQSRRDQKPWVLGSLLLVRVGVLLLALIPLFSWGLIGPGVIAVLLMIIWSLPGNFFNIGFIPFLTAAIPADDRAAIIAGRNAVSAAVIFVINLLFGWWLTQIIFPFSYQSMYVVGFIASVVSLYFLTKVHVQVAPPPLPLAQKEKRPWKTRLQDQVTEIRRTPELSRIIIDTFLHSWGLWLAAPLYVLYYVRSLGASDGWLGLQASISSLCVIVGNIFWRKQVERRGEQRILQITIVALASFPFWVGVSPSLTWILAAVGLNGLLAAGVSLSHFNLLINVIPEARRFDYIALYLTIMNLGAFVAPLIGITIAGRIGMGPTLIACGILSVLGSLSFWIFPVQRKLGPSPALPPP